ncbi:unnamed protein product, partial [Lepidochelys olivacea]
MGGNRHIHGQCSRGEKPPDPPPRAPSPALTAPRSQGLGKGREFLTPTVWPSTVVGFGGSITIRCEGRYPGMKFFLLKALGLAERMPGRGAAEDGGGAFPSQHM